MLKLVLMDLFPFIIEKENLYNFVWKNILTADEYINFSNNEDINPLLYKDLNEKSVSDEFLSLDAIDKTRALEIVNKYDHDLNELTKKYFEHFQFSEVIQKFLIDAKTSSCKVVFMNNDNEFEQCVKLMKFPSGATLSCNFENIDVNNLEEKLTEKSIALNEFIYFTSDHTIIEHLLEKGYFCATISTNSNDSHLIAINSINDLNFGNLALNFYDKSDETAGEL